MPIAAACADPATRRCVVTRAVRPKRELVRFVLGPDGRVVPDIAERLPGRGLWVTARRAELEKAARGPYFSRAARAEARVAGELVEQVAALLVRRCIELIGLARRAGAAVAGFEKVREWLRKDRVGLLIEASDVAAGGAAKLRGVAPGVPGIGVLDSVELGSAFGRERIMHAALAAGHLADRLQTEAFRLSGFRQADERT